MTPLHHAAMNDHGEVVKSLLMANASLSAQDKVRTRAHLSKLTR